MKITPALFFRERKADTSSVDKKTSSDKELSEGPLLSAVDDSIQDESKAAILALSEGPLSSDSEHVPAAATATALELRFQAELNQMEVIQQAEKQLGQISQFKDAVDACHKAAVRPTVISKRY